MLDSRCGHDGSRAIRDEPHLRAADFHDDDFLASVRGRRRRKAEQPSQRQQRQQAVAQRRHPDDERLCARHGHDDGGSRQNFLHGGELESEFLSRHLERDEHRRGARDRRRSLLFSGGFRACLSRRPRMLLESATEQPLDVEYLRGLVAAGSNEKRRGAARPVARSSSDSRTSIRSAAIVTSDSTEPTAKASGAPASSTMALVAIVSADAPVEPSSSRRSTSGRTVPRRFARPSKEAGLCGTRATAGT